MTIYDETAGSAERGGPGNSQAVVAKNYQTFPEIATAEYASAHLASRFRLTISTAREVCRIAGIGGAL